MKKQTITGDELIAEIAEVLAQSDSKFIEKIANEVLVPKITYVGDWMYERKEQ